MVQLPSFTSTRSKKRTSQSPSTSRSGTTLGNRNEPATSTDYTATSATTKPQPSKVKTKRLSLAILYLLSLIFLILVLIGSISDKPVLRNIYFMKLDVSNVIPLSIPNAILINSIAQTIGLHDFYQVGLWNFCEGYNGQGITNCSKSKPLYWFNPVEIILNELLSGATIAIPAEAVSALNLVRLASHWMFGLYLAGAVLLFLCIFISPWGATAKPRYYHRGKRFFFRFLPITILSFWAAFCVTVASVVATVMFIIFRSVFQGQTEVNIKASLGIPMLVFMWLSSAFALLGFIWELGACCCVCCCSGSRKAKKTQRESMTEKTATSEGGVHKRSTWSKNEHPSEV